MHHFSLVRRHWLSSAGVTFTSLITAVITPVQASDGLTQPESPDAKAFMSRAILMRDQAVSAGDQAFGAVVVRDGRIVGQSRSRVMTHSDPTAHAEMEAIRDAASRLGRRLTGCTLYSSSRPCPMCEAAAYWANIDRMIHGLSLNNAGSPTLCG
ncbi:MAG: tRNA(Arg) A34 adenosine deaminase TadA [Parasphingorhabdus sp.]|jgi:tRNA(Arg) A34 adenosine deaminase TadA